MSPLFGAGACLRKISPSKLRLMRIPIDRSLFLHQTGTVQSPPLHKHFRIRTTNSLSLFAKKYVLLPGTARQCARVPALFRCRRLPAGAPVPAWVAMRPCARRSAARRPACSTSALQASPGRPPRTWGLIAVRCCHGCDLCRRYPTYSAKFFKSLHLKLYERGCHLWKRW